MTVHLKSTASDLTLDVLNDIISDPDTTDVVFKSLVFSGIETIRDATGKEFANVVRCGKCKHASYPVMGFCHRPIGDGYFSNIPVGPYDFCSKGERP